MRCHLNASARIAAWCCRRNFGHALRNWTILVRPLAICTDAHDSPHRANRESNAVGRIAAHTPKAQAHRADTQRRNAAARWS